MGILDDLADLFTDEVTITAPTGLNTNGERTYVGGATTTYTCRVRGKNRLVRAADGRERVSSVTVTVMGTTTATPEHRIELPADWTPRGPKILAIERNRDEDGRLFDRIYCE